ncbi:cyclase family protein [Alicyclobacillus tolerans]|uniref:Arylformamidase n=2 Tax=Alicyclobacillus tolerans TaxID=90970 RepID=A0ABT9LT28_9BACL|nr:MULTISPECIES: cyclase family protein [Alicyclobacillus]MDP9727412.1 arylformamidase [Alicyclobacillus tengchongensis]QRF23141.1 cyclase family protein [Alicyclobacillus sp. TC]SHJ49770.1 Kynurenine formamidase [Alicyclobacillus montanus]
MKIHDISMRIYPDMAVYKNKDEKRPQFEITSNFINGEGVRETRLHMDAHTGTHVDAKLHMLAGQNSIDTLPLEQVIRKVRVIDFTHVDKVIEVSDLQAISPEKDDFLLFHTANSNDEIFNPEFVYLSEQGAQYLVEKQIAGVGIDGLGIERSQPGHPTHKILFDANIVIIEGLRLAHIVPGEYFMVAAPLYIEGIEAAPARVVLIEGLT